MPPFARVALVCVGLWVTQSAPGQTAPTKAEMEKAIKDLGSGNFTVREKSSALLRAAGRAAEPFLKEVQNSKDAEVARRSSEILDEFKWGVFPDTPKEVLAEIDRYRGGNLQAKQTAITALTSQGGRGFAALLRLAGAEDNADLRASLYSLIARETTTALPGMIVAGNHAIIDEVLELSAATGNESAARNYAAYLLLRGRLDDKLPVYKARAAKNDALLLAYLFRAQGNLAAARAAAETADAPELATRLLVELGDWKALAKRYIPAENDAPQPAATMVIRVAYHRLADEPEQMEKALTALRAYGDTTSEQVGNVKLVAKGLFLNDRPNDAIRLLVAKKQYQPAFDVLSAQLKHREAFELIEKLLEDEGQPARALDVRRAHFLYQLGSRDEALAIFQRVADDLKANGTPIAHRDLVRAYQRVGRLDLAHEQCGRVLALAWGREQTLQVLRPVFGDRAEAADSWWTFLRNQRKGETEAELVGRLRDIFERRTASPDFDELAREMERTAEAVNPPERQQWFRALEEAALALGKDELAQRCLMKLEPLADDPAALLRIGDWRARRKEFKEAAELYHKAWEKDRQQPLPLFLQGWALAQAGQEAEGRKWQDMARLLPLAGEELRYHFAAALEARGHADLARRERELLLTVGPVEGWHLNETLRLLAYDAMARKDHARAADLFERFRLRCLHPDTTFNEYGAYVHVPALVHFNRARALIAAGKFDEAKKAAREALSATPGNLNVSIQLVADLDKADRKADADELFDHVFAVYEKVAADYPRCATLRNSLAWLGVSCRRKLDKALESARKAVELEPKHAGYYDTLSEVYFQTGNRDKALQAAKRCLELEPGSAYYARQLKRIEAGDPKAPVAE